MCLLRHYRPLTQDDSGSNIPGVTTGLIQLNNLLGGFTEGLYLLAGAPGMGKTTLALQLTAAATADVPVVVVTFEHASANLTLKLFCARAGINPRDVQRGYACVFHGKAGAGSPSERLHCGALFSNSIKVLVFSNKSVALSPLTSGSTPLITLDDLCAHLLPPDDRIPFQSLSIDEPRFILVAAMLSANATRPDCRQPTPRIHGHSPRTLADVPWATAPIELRVIVRRFRCCPCTGRRQTFAQRLPSVAPLSARTTTRLATTQAKTGLILGGAAGARHMSRHGVPGSSNTLLRRVRSVCLPEGPAPEIIGIDDWAWCKGNRYGTIIVDLQRGCPID